MFFCDNLIMRMSTKCGRNWSMAIDLSVTKLHTILLERRYTLYRDGMGEISRDPRTNATFSH